MNNLGVFSRANHLRESLRNRASAERERRYRTRRKALEAQRVRELFGIDLGVNLVLTDSEIDALFAESHVRAQKSNTLDPEIMRKIQGEIQQLSDAELHERLLWTYQIQYSHHVVICRGKRVRLGKLSREELAQLHSTVTGGIT